MNSPRRQERRVGEVNEVHFTDTETLTTHISSSWSEWGKQRRITRSGIKAFGELTDNHQWIHEDEERCKKESPYGALIAHGFFILSLVPGLLPPEPFVVVGHKQRIVRGSDHFRFPSPVFVDDVVHARARLCSVELAASKKGTVLTREIEVWSTTGEKPAVTCRLALQYF